MNNKVKIKIIKTASPFKVLDVIGDSGDYLNNHKVNEQALILMRSGNIIYKEEDRTKTLSSGESCDIPADVYHNVTCTTKAKFFVIMPNTTKMRFE